MSELSENLKRIQYKELRPELDVPADWLSQVSESLGYTLPEDYREFLTEFPRTGSCYGEALIKGIDRVPNSGSDGAVSWLVLFGFSEQELPDLIYVNELLDHRIDGYRIIGDDIFGNFFYMKMEGDDRGKIYFFDRSGGVAPSISAKECYHISNSFSDFIKNTFISYE